MLESRVTKESDRTLLKVQSAARDKKRQLKDKFINLMIQGGGIFVLVAVLFICGYLIYMSLPLFKPASMNKGQTYSSMSTLPEQKEFIAIDNDGLIGMSLTPSGVLQTYALKANGNAGENFQLNIPAGATIASVQQGHALQHLVGVGLSNGQLMVFRPEFHGEGVGNNRKVTTQISYPFGSQPLPVNSDRSPLIDFAIYANDPDLKVLAADQSGVYYKTFAPQTPAGGESALSAEADASSSEDLVLTEKNSLQVPLNNLQGLKKLFIGQNASWLYALDNSGKLQVIQNQEGQLNHYQQLAVNTSGNITAAAMLQGEVSLLLGDDKGNISQWFLVPQAKDQQALTRIRAFNLNDQPITVIQPESSRKGFLAGDNKGEVGYFFTTSERVISKQKASDAPIQALAISENSDNMLVNSAKETSYWSIDAQHPDVSVSSLWKKVWYESYAKPDYVWQSTSANADFEPKMSLVPLTFGSIKAAFYAMLLGAPLAIAGAMYTAAFMSPELRTKVKPTIELMQALPTVILGFLAGLWLAPLVTSHLPGIFSLLIITPIVILICGFLWVQIPLEKRNRVPDGIAPLMLMLPLAFSVFMAMYLSQPVEQIIFQGYDGSMVKWLQSQGVDYQSQNALIVGLIMGFAIIAPIFSISEDALFAVPKHLVNGSLALGATPWQTMVHVVLPTASPGIFSALMIGFGRAVGETMIVLMATGNTAIMDLSIFDGMRTLSANLAVEMGEAEVASTHFHVLFFSALVLFLLTFILNTFAELVRARLRKKYGSL